MTTSSHAPVSNRTRAASVLIHVVCACLLTRSGSAQTSYSISFSNLTGCDIKICAYVDQTADNCTSPYNLPCTLATAGNSVTYSFTVPAGHLFCYYTFKEDTSDPTALIIYSGSDPCSWNFSNQDLCNTGTPINGKGNCKSARFSE